LFGVLNMFFVVLGLLILIVFYGTYFFKMFLQRKQGVKTNQLGKGKEGIEKTIEISMQIMTILVPVFEICSMIFQFFNLDLSMKIKYLGVFVAFFGTIIFIISVITMKNNWRAGVSESEKTELVTNGIYKISRNPAFLGFDLVYIGFLLMFFNWILFVISCSTIILFHLQITKVEEPFLVKKFGEEYEHYKNEVFRYFGRNVFMKDKIKGEI